MTLSAGLRLGPYEIVALLGAGGMGEVYRARDTGLGRDVAVKILPRAVTSDPEQLVRFEREARVLASLNHPNIAAIHGLEEAGGIRALVLELVEGETLAARISRTSGPKRSTGDSQHSGGLPVSEVLAIASQLVDALEAAHEKGIVHRDLKPANIKITPDGVVKILDFGLAKAPAGGEADPDVLHSLADTAGSTGEGVILGTVSYMSPEQARGKPVDKRTDIWAFGCVLDEMLTGHVTFQGETLSDVIVTVLERAPDWTMLPPTTPPAIRRLLMRCLEKDPRRRLRDISDARADLEESPLGPELMPSAIGSGRRDRDVEFRRLTDFVGMKESPAISPDGKMVAFVAIVAGKRQILVCLLAGGALLHLTRDDLDHKEPRWAPDSSALIYYTPAANGGEDGTVWEISAFGGWPRRVASAIGSADISHDGRRLALFQPAGEQLALMTVTRDGARAERVALLPPGCSYTSPRWSPDDRSIAFQRGSGVRFSTSLEIVSAVDGVRREVCQSTWLKGFCWLPDGSGFAYSSSQGSTMLYPPLFNLRTIASEGRGDRQLTFGDQSTVEPDADHTGKLIANRITGPSDIWKFPVNGSPADNTRHAIRITRQTGEVRTPSASPDDTEIVYLSDNGGHGNLWVAKTDGTTARKITFELDPAVTIGVPQWSPTEDLIAFVVDRSGETGLWVIHSDGSGLRQVIASGRAPCWSGDGRWLYYHSLAEGAECIEKIRLDGGPPVIVRDEVAASMPAISADGSTLFYAVILRSNILGIGRADTEIRRARPETGASETLARIPGERIPGVPPVLQAFLSPDGQWLAMPLVEGGTTNLWLLPTAGGAMKPLTDFGARSIVIARSVSWSADSQYLYAAVAETETDIVLFDGLIE